MPLTPPSPPIALLVSSWTLLSVTVARLATNSAPPRPAPPPPLSCPAPPRARAFRIVRSWMVTVTGAFKSPGDKPHHEEPPERAGAVENPVVAEDGDVRLDRGQILRQRDVDVEGDRVAIHRAGDRGAQIGLAVDGVVGGVSRNRKAEEHRESERPGDHRQDADPRRRRTEHREPPPHPSLPRVLLLDGNSGRYGHWQVSEIVDPITSRGSHS